MHFALLAVVGAVAASGPIDVPTDEFVTGCWGVQMRAGRHPLTVVCRPVEGGIEIEIDDGDINSIELRAKRWPKTLRFVMKAWRFESMSVSTKRGSKNGTSVNVTRGDCDSALVRCRGRTTKTIGERRVSETITVPETEVTVRLDVIGSEIEPGASLLVSWIDAFRH